MTFNPEAELRALAEADAGRGGRKMAFHLQCAAFAALYQGVAPKVVRLAFKISPQTVSYISGCLEHDPDPYRRETVEVVAGHKVEVVERITAHDHNDRRNPGRYRRYENVAREFEALGKEEFLNRYMTPEILDKLKTARRRIANGFGNRPHPVNPDGLPNFQAMNNRAMREWKEAHPEKWAELFPQTPIDTNND